MARGTPAKRVIGIGVACLDQLILWQDMKAPVLGNRIVGYDVQGGGMAATALVTVARLGGQAEFWGAVGADWAADLILKGLRDENVDTSQVRRIEGRSGPLMIVCIDQPTGDRHFLRRTGLCDADRPLGSPDRLAGAGCLLVDDTRPETDLPAAREARRLGVPVVGDFSHIHESTRALLPHVDYAIVSEACARELDAADDLRKACRMIRDRGPACVAVTLGARGLEFLDGDRFGRMEAFRVDVVDTTGAGDVLHGAFCWGLVEGLPLEENLRFASAAAALKCRHLGGRAGIPRREEVVRFLQQNQAAP